MDRIGLDTRISRKESFLLANDGLYLGRLSLNTSTLDSISNNENIYGSHFSSISFKNRYSIYGSPGSSLSPYNPNTLTPPVIYLKGEKIGCLSKNVNLTNRVDPDVLNDWMIRQCVLSFPTFLGNRPESMIYSLFIASAQCAYDKQQNDIFQMFCFILEPVCHLEQVYPLGV